MKTNPNFTAARKLRESVFSSQIPNNKPGYYKWWATEDFLHEIFYKLNLSDDEINIIKDTIETKNKYYCIYIGIAKSESLFDRICGWHINEYNATGNVRHSTLRKSLTALFTTNKLDTRMTNNLIDKLFIEYFPMDLPIGTDETKKLIKNIENNMLDSKYFYIINILDNKHPNARITIPILKKLRKQLN